MTSSMVIQTLAVHCQDSRFFHLPAGWRSTLPGGSVDQNMGGSCKGPRTSVFTPNCPGFAVTVEFANPAAAGKMPLGKLVRLKGDFRFIIQNKVQYLLMQNAKLLYTDPFGR